jgi:hypothetical protein
MPGSSKWYPSLWFPYQNPVSTSPLSHTCHIPRPSQSSWFDNINMNIRMEDFDSINLA